MNKKIFCVIAGFIIFSTLGFSGERDFVKDFPSFYVKSRIEVDSKSEIIELYSDSEKASKILCSKNGNQSDYEILFENFAQEKWYDSALFYSQKSDTLYFHINTSPAVINGIDVYFDAGLYSFSRENGTFSKSGMKRYYAVENWIFALVWKAYVEKQKDFSGFLNFVYSISDSCEKVFAVTDNTGNFLENEVAVEYIFQNNLFSSDTLNFLSRYLKRTENNQITEKSAYTLNGVPELADSVCKNTLYSCRFFYSDDGLWIIREHSSPVKFTDDSGKTHTVYKPDYFEPLLLEDKNGKLCRTQPEALKNFKINPAENIKNLETVCKTYNGTLLMEDMDGVSYWGFKKGELTKKENYNQIISFIDQTQENEAANKIKMLYSFWKVTTLILLCLCLTLIFIITFVCSKKFDCHLSKKDKKLVFNIQDKERSKISKDLHDSVVQTIRAIRTDVEMLEVPQKEENHKQNIINDLTNSIILLRNICYNLTPAEIVLAENSNANNSSDLELLSVIDTLCKQFSQKTKIPCTINTAADFKIPFFSLEVSKNSIRIFQEILTNIEKHSFATSVNIIISNDQMEDQQMTKIIVIDDGIGGDINAMMKNKHHFGLRNIVENINLIGGKVEFYTKPNEGMNIILKIPCEGNNES